MYPDPLIGQETPSNGPSPSPGDTQSSDVMFKIHRPLLTRHSPFLSSLETANSTNGSSQSPESPSSSDLANAHIVIDPVRRVSALDMEILLQHLYHDIPLSPDAPFPRIASVLRVSSPGQLHFPQIHELALGYFAGLFPSGPVPFLHPQHLEEALNLAKLYQVTSIQKGLFYSLVTSSNFDTGGTASHDTSERDLSSRKPPVCGSEKTSIPGNAETSPEGELVPQVADPPRRVDIYVLSPLDSQRCLRLMTHLIDHFSPILFTAPATPHMACTDVFADTWMKLVIQPAIEDEGVYKPLETLERIKKNQEWSEEQESIWRSTDQWLGLDNS
ncbi:hypothetical protein B0H10DRAFT_2065194 [Mycena sp. CBHHK59/15]|nr:hypothetical protein B0H10DRAFT_2065194 [Mycena sp. CBHHK59/15]